MTKPRSPLFLLTCALLLGACLGGPSGPPPPAPVVFVELRAPARSLVVGQTVQLAAAAKGERGEVLEGRSTTWSSDDESVASVTEAGLVTAEGPGEVLIRATIDGVTGLILLTIRLEPVAGMEIYTPRRWVVVGFTLPLSAIPRDGTGRPLIGRATAWSTSDSTVAEVSPAGLVTGISPGTARITATVDGLSAYVDVTVEVERAATLVIDSPVPIAVGTSGQLRSTIRGISGTILDWQPAWSSSNPAIASVSATGLVTGHALGFAQIQATIDALSYQVTVRIVPYVVRVTPASATVRVGSSHQFQATLLTKDGPVPGEVTWSVASTAIATVDANGLVRGVAPGIVAVIASSGSVQDFGFLTVVR